MVKKIESADPKKKEALLPPKSEEEIKMYSMLSDVIDKYRAYIFPSAYKIVKNKLLFAGDLRMANQKQLDKNATAAIFPLTESMVDTFVANLYDSISIPKIAARRKVDEALKEQAQDFCDRAYGVAGAEQAKQLIRAEATLLGTSYGIASRESRKDKYSYPKGETIKTVDIEISKPLLSHVSFFELFTDLSTTDFYKARRKARRKILSVSEIEKRYSNLFDFTDDVKKKINASFGGEISQYDFTKIYDINSYSSCYSGEASYESWLNSGELSFLQDNVLFSINGENKLVELIEYRSGDELKIIINGYIYYDGKSPYPFGDPFGIVVYEKMPGTFMGRGLGQKLSSLQQQATNLYCKIRDAFNKHISPMYSVTKNMLAKDATGQTVTTINYVPNKVIQVDSPDVKNGGITPINFIDYNILQIGRDELDAVMLRAQEIAGTNSYVQGGQGKVERSGIAANLKVSVTKTRLKPIEASVTAFDQHMFEQRLLLATMQDSDIVARVPTEDGYRYTDVNPEDLINKFDISVDIDGLIEQTRVQRTQEALQLLQAIAPININPISQTPTISPESIAEYIIDQTGNSKLKAMSSEEREEYAKEHIKIASDVKAATEQQAPKQPQPLPGGAGQAMAGIDQAMQQPGGFFDANGQYVG